MVDQSELPFRLLCRRHGATCAYTPMLHARIFSQDKKYRDEMLTSCSEDRPLLVQFCANDPQHLLRAARLVEATGLADAIDINFGCPQRIAKRGGYGAFLMDDLPRVEALVRTLSQFVAEPMERLDLAAEYLALAADHPVPLRMVRGHVHKIIGDWLAEHTDLRETINRTPPSLELYLRVIAEVRSRSAASGRDRPMPQLGAADLAAIERAEAKQAAIDEQEREADALDRLEDGAGGCGEDGCGKSPEEDVLLMDWSDTGVFG
ncbi:tRNA-dihydrouridine(16/17) synthase [NAD(P)(+)] [Tetrabaena socialis]|uniref:tRNA-dihydrouridine(16/17) synthase [NAD(P)(+)] n=1 Tax=Tetrabaena socialis TaxID=47790 RepID=A0A2J8ABN4_9CHLO|nr:tRNA-dihydrouridine(16/17) synthase [NAD(P)(+)] [Tetrabaena socialis]|eukprot:PNH09931.1 tRNA-dihydrouridine(16/17) synthase [NAD(P)(+)] [Tetrabaena socialis]